jgi:hypothetical protein
MAGLEDLFGRFKDLRPKVKKAGFGKAPPIADVETEAAALRGFLGTTDYASRLEEQEKLAKLQMYLAMAQRGFGAMGEAPRPGESSLGTFGRTLAAPLLGDVSKIAGQIAPLRIAARAAEAKEARDIKLAAYTQAATRAKDLDATALGILKAEAARPTGISTSAIQNVNAEVQIDGKIKKLSGVPIILRKDNEGRSRFYLAGAHQADDGTKVKADTELSSFKKVPTKDQLPKLYENIGKTVLTIPLQAKAGRSPSINLGPTKRASLHPNEFSQLPEAVRRDLVEYKAPPQAGGSLTTWINVSGTPQSINLPDFSTILEDGKEITLTAFQYSQLPEVMKVGNVLSRKEKPTIERGITGQEFKNGKFVDLNNVTRATKFINGAPVDTYYRQLAEGRLDKIPQDTFTETIATHGAFNKEDSIHIALLQDAAGAQTGVVADALDDASATAGEVVDVWRSRIKAPNKGTDRVRYYFKGADVTGKIQHLVDTDAFQSGPLNKRDLQLAGQTADTRDFKPVSKIWATGVNPDLLNSILGTSDARAGEVIEVWRKPPGIGPEGETIPEEIQYRNRGEPFELEAMHLKSVMFQDKPLTADQKEKAGQTVITRQPFVNTSSKPLTFTFEGEEITVPVDGRLYLSQNELGQLPREIQAGLGKERPVSTEPVRYTFREAKTLGGQPGKAGDQWLPGMEISLSPAAFDALPESVKMALTTDTGEKAVIRKKRHITSLVNQIRKQEPGLANARFGTDEMNAVLAQFPGTARGASAANALYNTIVFTMKHSDEPPAKARNNEIISTNEKAALYRSSVEDELKGAKKIYEGFQRKNVLPRTAFDQLPFSERMAFARIPRRGLNIRNVNARWGVAKTSLDATREKYTAPTAEDVAEFANKVKIRAMLNDILTNKDLGSTGIIEGVFSKLGATLSDWPIVGSQKSGEFASTLQQLGANLRALSTDEGRPSNYRIGLVAATLPEFTTSETINTANVKKALATMDANIKSYFSDAVSSNKIVPQSFSRMAAEAGLKGLGVDQGKYWWLDPEKAATEELPFTMEGYRRSLGQAPWTLSTFDKMKPGEMLPQQLAPVQDGKQTYWIKLKEKDKDGRGMIIQTDKDGRVKKGAEPLTFVFGED